MKNRFFLILALAALFFAAPSLIAAPVDPVDEHERCAVCGMFVAKYKPWMTQLHQPGEKVVVFDGVKDMMAYYFNPSAYGGAGDAKGAEIWVKDYYGQEWIDGRTAFYVVGSDVMGPMGEELVPLGTQEAAENFLKDHKGTKVMKFEEIQAGMIMDMKKKHMMKMKKMKPKTQ